MTANYCFSGKSSLGGCDSDYWDNRGFLRLEKCRLDIFETYCMSHTLEKFIFNLAIPNSSVPLSPTIWLTEMVLEIKK